MYLSRLRLAARPDVAALAQLLNPQDDGRRMDAHHRLLWTAFAGDPDARRDFLWREMGDGSFMVLSPRPPAAAALFEPPESRDFAPALAPGDRLAFVLRANATRTVVEAGGRKRHRDVVMEALHGIAPDERAARRMELAQAAGMQWLEGQGTRAGFVPDRAVVTAYRVLEPPRATPARGPRFGVIDLEGVLRVTDPVAFLDRLAGGFGRAKAFGCGLMLIRRG